MQIGLFRMLNNAQQNSSASDALFAIILFSVAAIGLWYATLASGTQVALKHFLFETNHAALVTTGVISICYFLCAALFAKKRSLVLTRELAQSYKEMFSHSNGSMHSKRRWMVIWAIPFVLSVVYVILYNLYDLGWRFSTNDIPLFQGSLKTLLRAINLWLPHPLLLSIGLALAKSFLAKTVSSSLNKTALAERLPPVPRLETSTQLQVILGCRESQTSKQFEPSIEVPSWVTLSARESSGGIAVFGMKGSGKTQLLLRIAEQAMEFAKRDAIRKPTLCVIDIKGDLSETIKDMAQRAGRASDVVHLGVQTTAHWNPIGHLGVHSTASECRQAGYFLRCAMSAGDSSKGDTSFWTDNADNLCFRTLHVLSTSGEFVNFANLYKLVVKIGSNPESSAEYRKQLFETCKKNLATNIEQYKALETTEAYFEDEFVHLSSRVRTIVVNVLSNFLQKFLTTEYQSSFGRPATDAHHFDGFREVIATGKIFILDIRSNEHGTIASEIATLVKLFYMAAVKTRDRYQRDTLERKTILIADEYQNYLTVSSRNTEGDDKYFELSRSFGAIDIMATQQFSSIVAASRDEATAQRIVGNFNNLVAFKHNDPKLTRYISDLCGTEERIARSVSVQEGASSAESHILGGVGEKDHSLSRSLSLSVRDKALVDANEFKSLSQFEAIAVLDGTGPRRVSRFFVKPYFCKIQTPHVRVMELLGANP